MAADAELPSYAQLRQVMRQYEVKDLVNEEPAAFERRVRSLAHLEGQRRFRWGHNHDFGTFALEGELGNRHLWLVATFIDRFGALPRSLDGLRVLDLGCRTGGTSLLLCAMGAQVVAVEKAPGHWEALAYLRHAFDLERLEARNLSLYDCTGAEFREQFDVVLFAGVLYHISDPIVALRIAFNALRDGGRCLVETVATDASEPLLLYRPPELVDAHAGGSQPVSSRASTLVPSRPALRAMLQDVGFVELVLSEMLPDSRCCAVGTRAKRVPPAVHGLALEGLD